MIHVTVWSPRSWANLAHDLTDWLRKAFDAIRARAGHDNTFQPPVELIDDGDDVVVRLELPGIDVDNDVEVELEEDWLTIRGTRRDERPADAEDGRKTEFRYGSFAQAFILPTEVSADSISTSYDAGVLSVRVAGANAPMHEEPVSVSD